jgi:hypothetical protein
MRLFDHSCPSLANINFYYNGGMSKLESPTVPVNDNRKMSCEAYRQWSAENGLRAEWVDGEVISQRLNNKVGCA